MRRSFVRRSLALAIGVSVSALLGTSADAQTICPFADEARITGTVESIPASGIGNPAVGVRAGAADFQPAGCRQSNCAAQLSEGTCMVWPMAANESGYEF